MVDPCIVVMVYGCQRVIQRCNQVGFHTGYLTCGFIHTVDHEQDRCGAFPGNSEDVMRSAGIPDWWLESCWKISYLFPKGHAAVYVKAYMHMAWYKVHHPMAFYVAYFIPGTVYSFYCGG